MQPKLSPWNFNNKNVLVVAGNLAEYFALKYGIYVCQNEINMIPCKYLTVYSEDTIRYLFEIIKPPMDDVTHENAEEIKKILEIEGEKSLEWLNGMEKFRMFVVKKLADVGPVINDYISSKTGKITPLTRGAPRYTTYEKIRNSKLTSELKCIFDEEEFVEEKLKPAKTVQVIEKKPKKSRIPLIIALSATVLALAILTFIIWPGGEDPEQIKKENIEDSTGTEKKFILEGNVFDSGKSEIKEQSVPVLKNVLAMLKAYPDWRIKITGYTDNIGPENANISLSTERAKAVWDWFLNNGIEASRMTYEGKGSSDPVADNNTNEGRRKNRRTEINVISNQRVKMEIIDKMPDYCLLDAAKNRSRDVRGFCLQRKN